MREIGRRERRKRDDASSPPAAAPRLRLTIACAIVALAVAWAWWAIRDLHAADAARMDVLAVSGGSAVVISQPGGAGVLINAGGWDPQGVAETATRAARVRGVTHWAAIYVTSHTPDAYAAIPSLLSADSPTPVVLPPDFSLLNRARTARKWLADVAAAGGRAEELAAGRPQPLGDVTIEPLWPPQEPLLRPKGANPLLLRVSAAAGTVLVVGAASPDTLNTLAARAKADPDRWRSDVLVATATITETHVIPLFELARFAGAKHIVVTGTEGEGGRALESNAASAGMEVWLTPKKGAATIRFENANIGSAIADR
jgi:beta-lactamase superfamily II metal-dependent hydrolase